MTKNVLIIGGGFLGGYIVKEFENSGISCVSTHFNRSKNDDGVLLDIRDIDSINKCVLEVKPDLIINCAAMGQIDFLEQNPAVAFSINSDGAKNIALVSNKHKIRFIHISTDSIFDGKKGLYTENDMPNPLNVYARSKYLAEQSVKENCDNHVIIRTNFYGFDLRGNWFFNWVLNSLLQNKKLIGFTDIFFNPLEVSNLSAMILELSQTQYNGVLHLASNEIMSKYDFILKVAEIFRLNKSLVSEGTYEKDANVIANRPRNTTLVNTKAIKLLNTQIISISNSLEKIKKTINSKVI